MPQQHPAPDAPAINPHLPEFDQAGAAAYVCNGSGAVSPRSIRRATEDGELHPIKIGRKWLYSRSDLDAWVESK